MPLLVPSPELDATFDEAAPDSGGGNRWKPAGVELGNAALESVESAGANPLVALLKKREQMKQVTS